jgi:carboxyl-terminal processing protease
VKPDFKVQAAWRDELFRRLTAKGVEVERDVYDKASRWIDRELEIRVTRLAFGDSTARRRTLADDSQLRTALDLLRRGQSQQDLFALVTASAKR